MITLCKIITSILLENSLLTLSIAGFDEVSHHIAGPAWRGNDSVLQIDSKKLRASVQQKDFKKVNPANNPMTFSKWILYPLGFQMAAQPWPHEKSVYLQEKILNTMLKCRSDKWRDEMERVEGKRGGKIR